ncbi:DUF2306 domain-containing protein [Pseudoalteromonas obscura]|uniref:DUF2306 domain-containing protein n=1 Tax=Pseudoalteromonas obscura TaxID=3048491 RepID=A0ABT7ERR4_9GAMM|nr:DUF2306 domain-containing protein [Pseudoalteromonas sp. P94(2023)]MDK2597719.1 DUF2306 domain-containing protein [Pseudoalteromonas sp. P94(2023)]
MTQKNQQTPFNWPVVSGLLLITAIPGIPAIIIVALVLLGAGTVAGISNTINPQYFSTPAAILTHGFSGAVFFLTMPWQFSPRIRLHYPKWHKFAGRFAALSGCVMALSGIWMHLVLTPNDLGARFIALVIMSVAIVGAFGIAIWSVLNGQIVAHTKWMMRAVAICLAAITPLLLGAILQVLLGSWQETFKGVFGFYHDYDRLIAMAINLILVEWLDKRRVKVLDESKEGVVSESAGSM